MAKGPPGHWSAHRSADRNRHVVPAAYYAIAAFTETDFRADLQTVPTLIVHGSDDQICPIDLTGKPAAATIRHARSGIYKGGSHSRRGAPFAF